MSKKNMTDLSDPIKDPFLITLGERLKMLRARRGMTRARRPD